MSTATATQCTRTHMHTYTQCTHIHMHTSHTRMCAEMRAGREVQPRQKLSSGPCPLGRPFHGLSKVAPLEFPRTAPRTSGAGEVRLVLLCCEVPRLSPGNMGCGGTEADAQPDSAHQPLCSPGISKTAPPTEAASPAQARPLRCLSSTLLPGVHSAPLSPGEVSRTAHGRSWGPGGRRLRAVFLPSPVWPSSRTSLRRPHPDPQAGGAAASA